MTVVSTSFYVFDDTWDMLIQKTDGGATAFTYPLDTVLSSPVVYSAYDGIYFWSMEDVSGGNTIKRWKIENSICTLKQTLSFTPNFSSDTFAVEHYVTALATTVTGGQTVISLSDYNSKVYNGVVLSLSTEDLTVVSVSGTDITLISGALYSHAAGEAVNFYNYLWVFNSYLAGTLHKINPYTGDTVTTYSGTEYDDITACVFAYVTEGFSTPDNALVYLKSSNLKYLNVDDMTYYTSDMTIDNLRIDGITVIRVYGLSIVNNNIYRLQIESNYYGANVSWSTYNYVLSTTRRFINTISFSAYPTILPANGVNTTRLLALVNDQYGDGVWNKPISYTDTDTIGFVTINPAYTDNFYGTGEAVSYYKAGTDIHIVTVEATATQYD
jgi:hypothetical protein